MKRRARFGLFISLALILSMISASWTLNAAQMAKPAIVLAAFGTFKNNLQLSCIYAYTQPVRRRDRPEPRTPRQKRRSLDSNRVELVGSGHGFYEVEEAWLHLITKGYGNIQLLVAQTDQKGLRPIHPLVRLSG